MRHTTMHDYAGQVLCPRCGADTDGDTWPCCADGHDCSETCAKKRHSEEVCDKCEQELNTQLPTSVELCRKSKWEVRKGMTGLGAHFWPAWYVIHGRGIDAKFDTWREAMDYADRMARTREVVLPRLDFKEPLSLHIATMKGELTLISSIADSDYYDWETGPEPFAKFGALLLALAELEESCRE